MQRFSPPCAHQLIEASARGNPNAIAVLAGRTQFSCGELNARANQLAHFLREKGVGPEILVGLYLSRSADMLVGILGILKAGGAYVPLDPTYPAERLALMLQDSQAKIVITSADLLRLISIRSRA